MSQNSYDIEQYEEEWYSIVPTSIYSLTESAKRFSDRALKFVTENKKEFTKGWRKAAEKELKRRKN